MEREGVEPGEYVAQVRELLKDPRAGVVVLRAQESGAHITKGSDWGRGWWVGGGRDVV